MIGNRRIAAGTITFELHCLHERELLQTGRSVICLTAYGVKILRGKILERGKV